MSDLEQQIEQILGRKLVDADRAGSHSLQALPPAVWEEMCLLSKYRTSMPVVMYLKLQTRAGLIDICLFGADHGLFVAGESGD